MREVDLFRVRRPPVDIPRGPKIHRGIAARNNRNGKVVVLHNTPELGEHVGSFEEFAAGLSWMAEPIPVTGDIVRRFNFVTENPRGYDLLINNCEHTATAVEEETRRSPTIAIIGIVGFWAFLAWASSE